MALPVWKANGTAVSGTGAITVNGPTGHAIGDFLVLEVNSSNQAVTLTTNGGTWTPFPSPNGTGTGTAAAADSCALHLYYKFATSTTESVGIADSGDHTLGVITSFTGVDTTTPLDLAAIAWATKSTNSTSDTFPAVTTSGADRLVCAAISTGQESVKSSPTFAGLGSFTARSVGTTTSGVDGGIALFSGTKATAGSTGTGSVTESITSKAITCTFALNPVSVSILDKWLPRFAAVGRAYGWNIGTSGGPTSFTVTAGALPTGLSVNSSGEVTGTCSATPGVYTGTITASDGTTSDTLDFTITVLATAPLNMDAQLFPYTGTGGAGRVLRVNGIDLSGGGVLHVIQRRLGSESTRVGYVYASPTGGTSGERWTLNNANSAITTAATGLTLSNGSITLAADLNEAGRKYVLMVWKKAAGIADVITYTGSGAGQMVPHGMGFIPLLTFGRTSAGLAATGNTRVFNQYGYIGQWGSSGFWSGSGTTSPYTNTNSTSDLGVGGTMDTAAASYTVGMVADNPDVTQCGFIYSQANGAPIPTHRKVHNLWWAPQNNVNNPTPYHVARDLQPGYTFGGYGTPPAQDEVHGYFLGALDPAATNFMVDPPNTAGLACFGSSSQYNEPTKRGLWIAFLEGPDFPGTLAATLDAVTVVATGEVTGGGPSPASGTLTATLGAATCASTGIARAAGTLSGTLAALASTATATAPAAGASTASLAAVTLVAAGNVRAVGTLSGTLAAATLTSAGTAPVAGQAPATLGALALVSTGLVAGGVIGTLTVTLADASVAATSTAPIVGSSSNTLGAAGLVATGTARAVGQVTATMAAATLASVGTAPARGTASSTLAALTGASIATAPSAGASAGTLDALALVATGRILAQGALNAALANATAAAAGTAPVVGAMAATLAPATLVAAVMAPAAGVASITTDDAIATATGAVGLAGQTTCTLDDAGLACTGTTQVLGELAASLGDATLLATGAAVAEASGALVAVLDAVSASITGQIRATAACSATMDDATAAAIGTTPSLGGGSNELGELVSSSWGTVRIAGAASVDLADATCMAAANAITYTNGGLVAVLGDAGLASAGNLVASPRRRPIPQAVSRLTTEPQEIAAPNTPVLEGEQEQTDVVGASRPTTPAVRAVREP